MKKQRNINNYFERGHEMKMYWKIAVVIVVAVVVSYVAFGQRQRTGMMQGGMMGRGMQGRGMMDSNDTMMQRGMMQKGMMGQQGMMQKGMMGQQGMMGMHPMSGMMCNSSLAATGDGGVVVLMGNKLSKYDNNLNLVKEVEIKIDWENWKKTMEQHSNMMMQHRNMMMGGQSESR
jgi:hypothetical protein